MKLINIILSFFSKKDEKDSVINTSGASDEAIRVLAYLEGFRSEAYQDSAGVWTIGYGSTKGVKEGDTITEKDAKKRKLLELKYFYSKILNYIEVELEQNQIDAILLFVYNIGVPNFVSSTLLKKLNKGDYLGASNEFERWVFANGQKLNGLIRRRKIERAMFRGEDYSIYMTRENRI